MNPTLVLVGRPNVGKSTLFNRITRSRDAIVADMPGLTRDRHYGHGRIGDRSYLVVDTGGFEPISKDGMLAEMAKQTMQAVDEADVVIFIVDGREGLTAQDKIIANTLRKARDRLFLVVNKAEGTREAVITAEFHELGLGDPLAISASHGEGVSDLVELALAKFPLDTEDKKTEKHARIAIVGRPNVGKSTLVNTILGEERVIAFDQPGTTRDSIYIDFERNEKPYTIIDTAGMRRRGRREDMIEKFSVVKAIQAIEDANAVVLVLDARQDISDQDAHLAGFILESGRSLVVAVNKWEGLSYDEREQIKRNIERKLNFLSFAKFHYLSALQGTGVDSLFKSIDAAYAAAMAKLPTPRLTRVLRLAVDRQTPPRSGIFRPKLRYAHQGGMNPPVVVIHGSGLDHIPASYKRYLEHFFADAFKLQGTPLRIQFKQGHNPFANA